MYAIIQLVVEASMLNGATYITTFKNIEEAKEAFKKETKEEKTLAKERGLNFEEDFYEGEEEMEYVLKFDDYATKYQIVDLNKKFNSITF